MGELKKLPHLALGFYGEYSLGPKYRCKVCKQPLWTEKSQRTGGREWYKTEDGKRHFKIRCNFKKGAS